MRWLRTTLLLVASCRTAAPRDETALPPPPPLTPKSNAVRVRAAPFDVSACARPTALTVVNKALLAAYLEFERPRFEACLSDPSSRKQPEARALLDVTVGKEVSVKTSPEHVSESAVACLEARAKGLTLTAASALTARLTVKAPPEASDAPSTPLEDVSTLREAVTTRCACFESLGINAPPQLVLKLGPQSALNVVTSNDPVAEKVERCLEERLAELPKPSVELTVDLPLLNGDANAPSPDASADLSAIQTNAIKRRHAAHVRFLDAQRTALTAQLQTVAASYKRKPTPSLAKERGALCDSLIEIEDTLPALVERAESSSLESISVMPSTLCTFARESEE